MILHVWISFLLAKASAVYVFSGNPYERGSFDPVQLMVQKDTNTGPPFAAVVYCPPDEGEYAAIFFAGGLYSYMPVTGYHDILSAISSHGFVVIGVELFQYPNVSLESNSGKDVLRDPEKFFEELDWMRANLSSRHLSQYNVTIDWNHLGFSCHSDGCDYGIRMFLANSTRANFKSAVFYGPFSFHILEIPNGTRWPSLSFGTEFGEQWPPCCSSPFDFRGIYDHLSCPRILTNVKGFGHCDLLDKEYWTLCNAIHLCKTDPNNNRLEYKKFTQGIGSAVFIASLQGNTSTLIYSTNKTLIPLPLVDLQFDISCWK